MAEASQANINEILHKLYSTQPIKSLTGGHDRLWIRQASLHRISPTPPPAHPFLSMYLSKNTALQALLALASHRCAGPALYDRAPALSKPFCVGLNKIVDKHGAAVREIGAAHEFVNARPSRRSAQLAFP
jgi:hypothetical protein